MGIPYKRGTKARKIYNRVTRGRTTVINGSNNLYISLDKELFYISSKNYIHFIEVEYSKSYTGDIQGFQTVDKTLNINGGISSIKLIRRSKSFRDCMDRVLSLVVTNDEINRAQLTIIKQELKHNPYYR